MGIGRIGVVGWWLVTAASVVGQSMGGGQLAGEGETMRRAAPEGFVERAVELGLVHEVAPGMDALVEGTPMHGWAQCGVGLGDLDRDGDLDVVAAGGLSRTSVFRNAGGGFLDESGASGVVTAEFHRCVALGDVDRDGDLDLFLGAQEPGAGPRPGRGRLFANDGDIRFDDVTALSGTAGAGHTVYAEFHDLDMDGWLDLILGEFHGTDNLVYRNNGNGSFTDVAGALGLDVGGSTHAIAVADFDGDILPDVVVGNDWQVSTSIGLANNAPDAYLVGQSDGSWVDVAPGSGAEQKNGIMGIGVGDVDYDGRPDLYKTDVLDNHLLLNRGWPGSGLPWVKADEEYGVSAETVPDVDGLASGRNGAVSWAALFFDADLDRWLDLFVTNGHIPGGDPESTNWPLRQQNVLYAGTGPETGFRFADRTAALGLLDRIDDRGAALGDMDNDGDVDLFVVPLAGRLRYYENRVPRNGRAGILLRAVAETSAPDGIGCRARYTDVDLHPHVRWLGADGVTASSSAPETLFGLGFQPSATIAVAFPSGLRRNLPDVPAGSVLSVTEPRLFELSDRVVPAGATDPLTVSVYATSLATGEPLDAGASVQIELDGAAPQGPVVSLGGNVFARAFDVPGVAGDLRVEATIDGVAVGVRPRVLVTGPVESSAIGVAVTPEAVRAGTDETFEVTFTLRDAAGVALASPVGSISATAGGAAAVGPVRVAGDGRYTFVFDAPDAPGLHALDLEVDGQLHAGLGAVEAAGPVSAERTDLLVEAPNPLHQIDAHRLKLRLTARDGDGLRLGPSADVSVELAPGPGSAPAVVSDTLAVAQDDGDVLIVIEKPEDEIFGQLAFGTYTIRVDGVPVRVESFGF